MNAENMDWRAMVEHIKELRKRDYNPYELEKWVWSEWMQLQIDMRGLVGIPDTLPSIEIMRQDIIRAWDNGMVWNRTM